MKYDIEQQGGNGISSELGSHANGGARRVTNRASKAVVNLACTAGNSPPEDPLMSLKEVAVYLGMSLDYARHVWPQWVDKKVNPIRLNGKPKGPLRFRQSEILALVDSWRVAS